MFITFFDSKRIIHREFVSAGQTIIGAYYFEVLKRLMGRIRRIRPEYRYPETWSLLHDKTATANIQISCFNDVFHGQSRNLFVALFMFCILFKRLGSIRNFKKSIYREFLLQRLQMRS